MKYLTGILLPLLLQCAISYGVIEAGKGGGSFVGLGAMLLAVMGIPLTALANFVLVRAPTDRPAHTHVVLPLLVALILPVLQVGLMILVSVFRL